MRETLEREVKLTAGDGFVLPELGGEVLPRRVFTSTYHDTADLALARQGVTLRYRVEDGAGVWQLKLPKEAARVELEQGGVPARPPKEMLSLLVGHLRRRDVGPVARLRTRRETVRTAGAEIVDDSVSVFEGRRVVLRFRELEVELLSADEKALARLEKELRRAGATPLELRPKLFRALGLPAAAAPGRPSRRTPPRVALGLALAAQARALVLHDPGTRLGTDPEELHKFRVATRRLRAILRAGRPLLVPSWSEPLRAELGWLGRAVGPARDLDVLLGRLAGDVEMLGDDRDDALGLLAALEAERTAAREAAVEALSSDRYLALLERLEGVGHPETVETSTTLAELWEAEWRRTRKALAALRKSSPDEELHAARIRVKRVRYAAELAAHELGKQGKRVVAAARDLQDVLGEHQDAAVAEERIRAWAEEHAASGAAAGRLVELERKRKAQARAAWPPAWKALRHAAKPLT
jgi:CHAD domain-containing protein